MYFVVPNFILERMTVCTRLHVHTAVGTLRTARTYAFDRVFLISFGNCEGISRLALPFGIQQVRLKMSPRSR